MSSDPELLQKIKELSASERTRVLALNHYLKLKKQEDELLEKQIEEINKKHLEKCKPFLEESSKIINGERDLQDDEISQFNEYFDQNDNKSCLFKKQPIQNYWQKVFVNSGIIDDNFQEDLNILKHLKKVEVGSIDNGDDYKLTFEFSPNDYFANDKLTKTFHFEKDQCNEGKDLIKSEATEIEWKAGKNIVKKIVKKKQLNKKTGAQRVIEKEESTNSFFNFFRTWDASESNLSKLKDKDAEVLEDKINMDQEIGEQIANEIIPYSVEFYMGVRKIEHEGIEEEEVDSQSQSAM